MIIVVFLFKSIAWLDSSENSWHFCPATKKEMSIVRHITSVLELKQSQKKSIFPLFKCQKYQISGIYHLPGESQMQKTAWYWQHAKKILNISLINAVFFPLRSIEVFFLLTEHSTVNSRYPRLSFELKKAMFPFLYISSILCEVIQIATWD